MKYKVMYDGRVIGMYNVISNSCVEYTIDKNGIDELKKKGIEVLPMISKDYTGKSFPFFDNRIRNCKRFEGVSIGYQTDPVVLEEMS